MKKKLTTEEDYRQRVDRVCMYIREHLDKEIDIRRDHNINKLRQYVNIEYLCDKDNLLSEKDAPVDKGEEVFDVLYNSRIPWK